MATHTLLWRHVEEEQVFVDFLSTVCGEKSKHTELAINFVQK